jgi:hypothetical protein
VRFLLKDRDINCTRNSVNIYTAGCQPLLRALRFAQHNNMLQQADCIHSLVFMLWPKLVQSATHCHPSASTVCLTCTFAGPQNSLPKSGHEHYYDFLNIAYIISHVNTEFLDCFMGGLPALDTFPRFTCPQIIPHKLAFLRLSHLCTPCTDHPCSNCSENLPGSSCQRLLSTYASRTSVLQLSKKWSFVRGLHMNFTFHASQRHSSVHRLLSHTTAS